MYAWLLARVLAGHLRVRVDLESQEPVVESYHSRRRTWQVVTPQPHKSGRWRFVFGPRRSPVYRNVLVWIVVNQRLPVGAVDHKDGDKTNDHPDNIQTMDRRESDQQGHAFQADRAFARLAGWFGYVAFWGEEPDRVLSPAECDDYARRTVVRGRY